MNLLSGVISLILIGIMPVASPESSIGSVKTVAGTALVLRGTQTLPAAAGLRILPGDLLRTGPNGSIGVVFKDDMLVSLGPNTEFVIDEYIFSPAEEKMSFAARLIKGTGEFLTGLIAKLSPQSVKLRTPKASIGIRGTHILVRAEEASR